MVQKSDYDNNKNCPKCGGNAKLEKVISTCTCGAVEHYRKTCRVCGFVSFIHRMVVHIEDDVENVRAA